MTAYDSTVVYDSSEPYDGAAADRNPSRNLRFEVAFTTTPLSGAPVWVDLTSRLDLRAGITNRCGRTDEFSQTQTGACDLTLDNSDGALTAENAASPYYPNVVPQKRARLTYVDPATAAETPIVDGVVDEWPVEWPGGQLYAEARITLVDLFSWLGSRDKLRSVVVETMALDNPVVHFPLSEPDGSTTVSDIAGPVPSTLTVQQRGSGGTLEFARGTGVPTDGQSAPVFTRASAANGLCLVGTIPTVGVDMEAITLAVVLNEGTTGFSPWTVVELADRFGNRIEFAVDASDFLTCLYYDTATSSSISITHPTKLIDSQNHDVLFSLSRSGGTTTATLIVDGVLSSSTTSSIPFAPLSRLTVGGGTTGMFTGTISHVAVFRSAVSAARALEHRLAQTTGFSGERSDQRIARIGTWIGLPTARQSLDVGITTSMSHVECTGMTPLEYMRRIETTEAGLLFISADGKLTFYNRARSYATTAPALSVPAQMLNARTRLALNTQFVKNDVTGSRSGGATVHQVDQASKDAYGPNDLTLELATTSDDDVRDAVSWWLQTSKDPRTRFTNLELDAYTDETYSPQVLTAVEIGARVEVTGMPSDTAPATTMRQTVQGYVATISDAAWSFEVNATPYEHLVGLVLDDATYGTTDSTNHLVY